MSTADSSGTSPLSVPQRGESYKLAVSSYDRTASTVIALLVLGGLCVVGLLIVYFTTRVFPHQRAVPVQLAEIASRPDHAAFGFQRDIEPPGVEEAPELIEPHIEQTLSAVLDVSNSREAILSDQSLDTTDLVGRGRGAGDSRQAGVGSAGDETSAVERWDVRFHAGSLSAYAKQLDAFGIELAVVGGDNRIHYAYHLVKPIPDRRTGPPEAEKRLYMTWRGGPLQGADLELLARAGISTEGRVVVQFYPPQVESELARLEKERAGGRKIKSIHKTIFGVKLQQSGYTFYVVDQQYHS